MRDSDGVNGQGHQKSAEEREEVIAYFNQHLGISRHDVEEAMKHAGQKIDALEKYFREHPPQG